MKRTQHRNTYTHTHIYKHSDTQLYAHFTANLCDKVISQTHFNWLTSNIHEILFIKHSFRWVFFLFRFSLALLWIVVSGALFCQKKLDVLFISQQIYEISLLVIFILVFFCFVSHSIVIFYPKSKASVAPFQSSANDFRTFILGKREFSVFSDLYSERL